MRRKTCVTPRDVNSAFIRPALESGQSLNRDDPWIGTALESGQWMIYYSTTRQGLSLGLIRMV